MVVEPACCQERRNRIRGLNLDIIVDYIGGFEPLTPGLRNSTIYDFSTACIVILVFRSREIGQFFFASLATALKLDSSAPGISATTSR